MAEILQIDMQDIVPGDNDRTTFKKTELRELANNIQENGLLQPITVRQLDIERDDPLYQIVAGERRFRACQLLGWSEVPAQVKQMTDEQASAAMLLENVARAELDVIDEAIAYQKRIDQFGWSIEDCALRAGVSSTRVQFRIKLLKLRDDIQHLIRTGNMKIGYAQILADGALDRNFQMIAMCKLRDNKQPTPAWFRKVVNELVEKQNQQTMFGDDLFVTAEIQARLDPKPIDPPLPSTTTPPTSGIQNHITFWKQAADQWKALGKVFKQHECEAAAQALSLVLATL